MMRTWLLPERKGLLITSVCLLLLTAWSLGQILRDESRTSALLFYMPSPALAFSLLSATFYCWKRGAVRNARWILMMTVVPISMVLCIENRWRADSGSPSSTAAVGKSPSPGSTSLAVSGQENSASRSSHPASKVSSASLRFIHWNIGWPDRRWPAQRSLLESLQPDICLLSETTSAISEADFPGYQILRKHNMLIACRGSMSSTGRQVRGGIVEAFVVTCRLKQGLLKLMTVDVASPPMLPRNPGLQAMMQVAVDRDVDIIAGDMNAPRRSLALTQMPHGFRHAYDAAGSGWSYTWPVPVPVLAIDQCICGTRVHPLRYQLKSTTLSDHRMQILDFDVRSADDLTDQSP